VVVMVDLLVPRPFGSYPPGAMTRDCGIARDID
jgi:hypothetical protein